MTAEDLAARWPLPDHHPERDALLAAYGDPARGYHDVLHLTEVLDRIDELAGAGAADDTSLRLAAWFHDGVYDGERGDEDRSAVWAEDALADTDHAGPVARLVRLTEHHDPAADDLAGQVLCDALCSSPQSHDPLEVLCLILIIGNWSAVTVQVIIARTPTSRIPICDHPMHPIGGKKSIIDALAQ